MLFLVKRAAQLKNILISSIRHRGYVMSSLIQRSALLMLMAATFTVAGCMFSERGMYEGMKQGKINECNHLPHRQRENCLKQLPGDYDEYKRQREGRDDG